MSPSTDFTHKAPMVSVRVFPPFSSSRPQMYTRRHAEQKEKKRAQKSAALIVTSAAAVAALSVILGVVIARARSTGK